MLVVRIIWDEYKPFELSYKMPIKDGGEREKTQKPYREIVSFFVSAILVGRTTVNCGGIGNMENEHATLISF